MISTETSNPHEDPAVACETCDIVVVGGGMAGVMAALAAKTPDNTVLIVEPSNVLGGQGTAGGVAGFCGDTERVNGLFAELIARLDRHGMIGPVAPHSDRREYDLEWCAFFLQEMVCEREIQVLLHSRVIGAECVGGVVGRLTIATAGGLLHVAPRFVIDASGACVIPVLTGFPVVHEGANKQLPMSLYFTMWDTGKKVNAILPEGCPRWTNDQEIPMTSLHVFPTGKTEVKMKVVGFDAADGRSLSEAEMFARRQMHGLIYYLQTHGYKDVKLDTSVLASVSRMIGVREERRIVGEHVLTEKEARSAAIFPDAVAVNNYHIDFHWPDRAQRAGTGVVDMLDPHHLPLRMLIPKGAKNLLVPGRGASGDQMAMSAFRVMAVVAQMGFAAGHAARQCVQTGRDLATIDVKRLQQDIEAGGQSLDLSTYGGYLRRDIFSHGPFFEEDAGFRNCGPMAVALLANGRFLAAWQGEAHGRTGFWLSERREKKWSKLRLAVALVEPLPGDISLTRAADGSLTLAYANGRLISEDEGVSWRTGGEAWETPVPVPVGNVPGLLPGGEFGSARLDDGTLAVAFNPVISGRVDFSKLRVALSMDEGATWPHQWDIANGSGKISHPALVPTRVGMGIVYLRDNASPAFWHGSIERIIDGADFVETEPLA